jgi:RHS repeat-associated protein
MQKATLNPALTHRSLRLFLSLLLGLTAYSAQAVTTQTRVSAFAYDPVSGFLTKEVIEPGDSQQCLVTEYTYDGFGNKATATTRNCNGSLISSAAVVALTNGVLSIVPQASVGEVAAPAAGSDGVIVTRSTSTATTYNSNGATTTVTTNALGHAETKAFEPTFGNLKSLTGPNVLTTSWNYDSFGRKILETRADTTTTSTAYYAPCDLTNPDLANVKYCIATLSTGDGRYTRAYYDSLNRKLATTHSNFNDSAWVNEGHVVYNNLGQVVTSYLPYASAAVVSTPGNPPPATLGVAYAKSSSATYDTLGRILTQTVPDDGTSGIATSTFTYNGLTTTVTNPKGQTKTTVKNSQGQTASVIDAQGASVTYSYDPFGNLLTTVDPAGNTTILGYDTRGRKKTMSDPDMGIWSYAYNALGELIRQVDAKLQTTTMVYDKLGRMTNRNELDLTSTWTYDTATKGIGKLTTAASGNGYSRTHSYDTLGRLSSTSTVIDQPTAPYVTSTTYDSVGRVSVQTYPNSFAVRNVYNTLGYLSQVVNNATNAVLWTANTMDVQGHLTQQTYGNGVVTQQVYSPNTGRLLNQYAGAGNAVQNMSYTYDSLSNLTTRTDVTQNLTETFGYDTINRVTSATATSGTVNTAFSYYYNAIGNITCRTDISACTGAAPNYAYNASGATSVRPHALTGITGVLNGVTNPTFSYDANGNMFSGMGETVTWTSFNMPQQITNGANVASFLYNPEHERTLENQPDGSTVITLSPRYDTGLHFEKKYISNQTTHVKTGAIEYENYLYAGGLMFGKYITITATDGITVASTSYEYYHKDHLGSITAITDGAGTVTQRLSYDVWGKLRNSNGALDPNGLLLTNADMYHGYTGHEHMDVLGIIHMNGRIYSPLTGRFFSADPTIQSPGNLQSYNRYSYGWNNPLNGTDPSGFSRWTSFRDNVLKPVAVVVISIYVGPMIYNAIAPSIMGSLATATQSLAFGAYAGGAVAGAISGAAVGALSGGIMGGNIQSAAKGAQAGALTGGIFGGLNAMSQVGGWGTAANMSSNTLAGGASSRLQGGSFENGAKNMFISQVAGWGYENVVGWTADPNPGINDPDNTVYDPVKCPAGCKDSNVSGFNKRSGLDKLGNSVPAPGEQGSGISKFINGIHGGAAVSHFHDYMGNPTGWNWNFDSVIINVSAMVVATSVSVLALLPPPLTVSVK